MPCTLQGKEPKNNNNNKKTFVTEHPKVPQTHKSFLKFHKSCFFLPLHDSKASLTQIKSPFSPLLFPATKLLVWILEIRFRKQSGAAKPAEVRPAAAASDCLRSGQLLILLPAAALNSLSKY